MSNCLNCNCELNGKFCSNCGQKSSVRRLTLNEIFHDIQHEIIHVDKGIFHNFKTIIYPSLIMDFIHGKRKVFFNPIVYLLFASAFFLIILSFYKSTPQVSIEHHAPSITDIGYRAGYSISGVFKYYGKYFVTIVIFPLALGSYWVFRKLNYNYWEHLYIHIFILANFLFLFSPTIPILNRINHFAGFYFWIVLIFSYFYFHIFKNQLSVSSRIGKTLSIISVNSLLFFLSFLLLGYIISFYFF